MPSMGEVRRIAEQGPRLRGCDRGGAHKPAVVRRFASRFGVASIDTADGILLRPPRAQGGGETQCASDVFTPIRTFGSDIT